MKHPFLGKTFFYYSLAWAVVIAAHFNILYLQFNLTFSYALSDALTFNLLLAGFGIIFWYISQYISPSNQGISGTVVSQTLAVIIGVSFITYLSNTVLTNIAEKDEILKFIQMATPWRIFFGSFILGMVVLVYYLLQYTTSLKQKEKDEVELQGLLKQAELDSLKSQLNPHFIFNSLNSISSLTLTDPESAHEMVVKLSEFLRGSLKRESEELHSLRNELKQMSLYLDIERVRFGDRLEVIEKIDEDCLSIDVPSLILQPLYENAIKYGIYEQLDKVVINTTVTCEEDHLLISISNNYDSEAIPQKGKGIGLKNVQSRLDLLYGKSDLVIIKKNKDKFEVELLIPTA